jgi:signal transduction histidine kinase
MIAAALPENEDRRLALLKQLGILDTLEEQAYDDLTYLAAKICDTPISLVSLVDAGRQWFKSHHGLDVRETPRELAFCAHAILSDDVFIVENADTDPRFSDNPLTVGAPYVKFYAGAPLILENNIRLGTLCIIDNVPRSITDEQINALKALSRQVVSQLQLRLKLTEMQYLDHAKDEFLAMVSHELRTPLTSITGSLTLLANKKKVPTPETSEKLIDVACRNSNRLLAIVNDILDIAKIEAGKLVLDKRPLDLIQTITTAIELNSDYCSLCKCQISIDTTHKDEAIMVFADEQRLLQVITNLVSNAAKFTHKEDTILVSLEKEAGNAIIKVTDHGPGLSESQQLGLFEKFKQINSSPNEKLPGTGLGLNICKHIAELHEGNIHCESIPDVETSFIITLPCMKTS